ncbi:hypothetical protein [Anaerobium acetethylicum]|uniref:hypothetical protein n=1 Tax=Anaerobium acetethylicum TaxID=1619234 RepID=UPI001471CC50|nr:hypothetical protein [Anaerobium acetethylicum]
MKWTFMIPDEAAGDSEAEPFPGMLPGVSESVSSVPVSAVGRLVSVPVPVPLFESVLLEQPAADKMMKNESNNMAVIAEKRLFCILFPEIMFFS